MRDVSCGYECTYVRNGDGSVEQRNIRINHVALVPQGRAGEHVRIRDVAIRPIEEDFNAITRRFHRRNAIEVRQQPTPTGDGLLDEMKACGAPKS